MGVADRARDLQCWARQRLPFLSKRDHDSVLPFVSRRPSAKPILPVVDMSGAIDFYERLGFDVQAYDDGYAWVRHCGWEYFHLSHAAGLDARSNASAAYLHVDDATAWRSAMVGSAPDIAIGELADQPWGMREYSLRDPSGNLVRIGQNL